MSLILHSLLLGLSLNGGQLLAMDAPKVAQGESESMDLPLPSDIPVIAEPMNQPIDDEKMSDAEAAELRRAEGLPPEPQPPRWSGSASGTYLGAFTEADPFLIWDVGINRSWGRKWSGFLKQGVVQNIYIDSSRKEFEIQDLVFGGVYRPEKQPSSYSWSASLSASLPLSKDSMASEVYSVPTLSLGAERPWHERLKLSLRGSLSYYITAYDSTPPANGEEAEPQPLMRARVQQGASLLLHKKWSVAYEVFYAEILYHEVSYEGGGSPALNHGPDQVYGFSASLDYEPRSNLGLSLGYSRSSGSSLLEQSGFDDYVIFDRLESRWAFGVEFRF